MSLKVDHIRALADRIAASHGLDVVDVEYQGSGKHRTLRVFIEKNEAERAKLRDRAAMLMARREGSHEEIFATSRGDNVLEEEPVREVTEEDREYAFEPRAETDINDISKDEDEAFLDQLPSVENLESLSGVTHRDCELFSRDFGTVLEVEELAPGTEYLLEISSPGLDRRLAQAADYRRFAGSLVKVQTFQAVGGNRHWQGRIAETRGETVILELGGKSQRKKLNKGLAPALERVEIELGNIEKAHLVPEF